MVSKKWVIMVISLKYALTVLSLLRSSILESLWEGKSKSSTDVKFVRRTSPPFWELMRSSSVLTKAPTKSTRYSLITTHCSPISTPYSLIRHKRSNSEQEFTRWYVRAATVGAKVEYTSLNWMQSKRVYAWFWPKSSMMCHHPHNTRTTDSSCMSRTLRFRLDARPSEISDI